MFEWLNGDEAPAELKNDPLALFLEWIHTPLSRRKDFSTIVDMYLKGGRSTGIAGSWWTEKELLSIGEAHSVQGMDNLRSYTLRQKAYENRRLDENSAEVCELVRAGRNLVWRG